MCPAGGRSHDLNIYRESRPATYSKEQATEAWTKNLNRDCRNKRMLLIQREVSNICKKLREELLGPAWVKHQVICSLGSRDRTVKTLKWRLTKITKHQLDYKAMIFKYSE